MNVSHSGGRTFRRANLLLGFLMVTTLAGGLVVSLLNPVTFSAGGHGRVVTGEWAASYQKAFEARFPLRESSINLWTALRYVVFRQGQAGVLIGADDWLFTDEEFAVPRDGVSIIAGNLAFVANARDRLRERGIELVIALVPSKARIYPDRLGRYRLPDQVQTVYHEAGGALIGMQIPVPDLATALAAARTGGPVGAEVFFRTDTHWTPRGARVAAEALASVATPVLDRRRSARSSFALEELAAQQHRGDLLNYLLLGPFAEDLGPRPETVVPVRAVETEAAVVGLFDDVSIPVTLIGTSYSAGQVWNLEAFLKHALGADVLNLAQEGRGPFAPMNDYLDGTVIDEVRPDLVIWEIPERYLTVEW